MGKMTRKQYVNLIKPIRKQRQQKGGSIGIETTIRNLLPMLLAIKGGGKSRKKALLDSIGPREMRGISEVSKNFLRRNIPVKPGVVRKMRKYKNMMHNLADRRVPILTKKRALGQHGGFLSSLLPIIAPLAAPLLGKLAGGLLGKLTQ